MKRTINLITSVILSFAIIISLFSSTGLMSFAENDIVKYLEYEIKDGKVTITNSDYEISGDIVIPDTIEGYPVVAITGGFHSRKGITSLTIGDGDLIIGSQAFHSCPALESIDIGDGDIIIEGQAFHSCPALESIEIGDGDIIIEGQAFHSCSALESIDIGDGDIIIEGQAFYDCTGLTSIKIGDGLLVGNGAVFTDTAYYNNSENWTYGILYAGNSLIDVKENVTSCEIKEGTFSIGHRAFSSCDNLTSITIPDGVEYIGDYAFAGCRNLTEIILPDSVKYIGEGAFDGCYKLTDMVIPDGVEYLSNNLFRNCTSLKNITIPDSIVYIGNAAFYDCSALTEISIPENVSYIGQEAFASCENLSEITLPEGLKSINNRTFSNCSNLENLTIPSSVKTIGNYAFSDCTSLTAILLPEGLISIGAYAFNNCSTLSSFTIPQGTEYISNGAFKDCSNIRKFIIDENNSKYSVDQYGVLFNKNKTVLLHYPVGRIADSYTIPEGVTIIGQDAFAESEYLSSVIIPEGVTTILNNAFENCRSITKINLPSSVTDIGSSAFSNCTNLADINLPEGISNISEYAFYYCTKLSTVTIPESVTNFGTYAFYGCSSLTQINIPGSFKIGNYRSFYNTAYYNNEDNWTDGVLYIGQNLIYAKDDIKSCNVREGTVAIASGAFENCRNLTDITIPDSVTCIGGNAFSNTAYYNNKSNWSNGLLYIDNHLIEVSSETTSCNIKNGTVTIANNAVKNYNLESVTFPDSLKAIGDEAFAFNNWQTINIIRIPANVEYIGDSAFENCSTSAIVVDENNEYFSSDENGVLFNKDKTVLIKYPNTNQRASYTVPDGVKHIEKAAFYNCNNLKKVTLPDSLTTLDDNAFYSSSNLIELTIPDSVTHIGNMSFSNCTNLKNITIPDSVTYIGNDAFAYCHGLTEITIPDSVTYIGDRAFYNNKNLKSFTLPSDSVILGKNIIFGSLKLKDVFVPEVEAITTTELTDSNGNKKVTYNYNGMNHLDSEMNDHDIACEMLRGNAVFADNSTYIANRNLSSAIYIKNVFIPDTVKYIGKFAFVACGVTDVYYGGSEEDWEKIAIDYGNHKLDSVTIHYNAEPSDMPDIPPEESTTIHPPETTTWEPETTTTRPPETTTRPPETTTWIPETTTWIPETTTWIPETTTWNPETTTWIPETTTWNPETTTWNPETTTWNPETTTWNPETTTWNPETTTGHTGGGLNPYPGVEINIYNFTVIIGSDMKPDDFRNNVYNNIIIILTPNGKVLDNTSFIGTGCIICVCDSKGNSLFQYETSVRFDINSDGIITAADARMALRAAATLDTLDGVYAIAADANDDGEITASDARSILRKSAGLDETDKESTPADFDRMADLMTNMFGNTFDYKTADTAYVVDYIIHSDLFIPTYEEYFDENTYIAYGDGNKISDPLNKLSSGTGYPYYKIPAENIKWICENIYQVEFDENYISNTGESYCYGDYVYIVYPQAGYGPFEFKTEINEYRLLDNGRYEISAYYYESEDFGASFELECRLKVIAEWKIIDGRYDWVFYNVDKL